MYRILRNIHHLNLSIGDIIEDKGRVQRDGNPNTPVVCCSPTKEQCYRALEYPMDDLFIFKVIEKGPTDKHKLNRELLEDKDVTGEKRYLWAKLQLVEKIYADEAHKFRALSKGVLKKSMSYKVSITEADWND